MFLKHIRSQQHSFGIQPPLCLCGSCGIQVGDCEILVLFKNEDSHFEKKQTFTKATDSSNLKTALFDSELIHSHTCLLFCCYHHLPRDSWKVNTYYALGNRHTELDPAVDQEMAYKLSPAPVGHYLGVSEEHWFRHLPTDERPLWKSRSQTEMLKHTAREKKNPRLDTLKRERETVWL